MEKGIWKIIPQDALKHFRELGNSDLLEKKKINIKDKLWVSIWPCRFRLTLPWRNSSVHQLSKILLSVSPMIPQPAHPAQNIPCHKLFRILNSFFQISLLWDIKVVAYPLFFSSFPPPRFLSPTPSSMRGWGKWGENLGSPQSFGDCLPTKILLSFCTRVWQQTAHICFKTLSGCEVWTPHCLM